MLRFLPLGATLLVGTSPLSPLAASTARKEQAPDSQEVLASAKRAQGDFEATRRLNLPTGSGQDALCDVRVGRFCYWYRGGDSTLPEEPRATRNARVRLLAQLEQAAGVLPGDEWIAGQRVRYLLEAGSPPAALAAARECRATPWWCEALRGLAHHAGGEFAQADSSFASALGEMPEPERCKWTDISSLLDGEFRKAYVRASCEDRAALAARWWWLATPLFSRPGNDRRTEHYARVTLAHIERSSSNAYGLPWGDDMRELLIRYGEPRSFSERPATALDPEVIAGHHPTPSFQFGPRPRALAAVASVRPQDWDVLAASAFERYAPRYATRFVPFTPQIAAFQRSDSVLIVASYDLSRDSLFKGHPVRAALALARDEASVVEADHDTLVLGPDVLMAKAPWDSFLVSVEITTTNAPYAARGRFGISHGARAYAKGSASLSDLLLFDPGDSLPASLAEALHRAYGSERIPLGRPLGLFWEIYGLTATSGPVTIDLALTPVGTGWLERAEGSLGLKGRRRAVGLRWSTATEPKGGVSARALAFDLSGVEPGRYRLDLTVTPTNQGPLTATREIEVLRR